MTQYYHREVHEETIMSLAHLKKKAGSISHLQDKLNQMKNKKSDSGETYWKLSVDASGNGLAEIRLLPEIEGEDFPFVQVLDYGIGVWNKEAGKKKWYIERSLETIGQKDPVKDEFWALHNLGTEEHKAMAKEIRDRMSYIVWIYVVSDKHAPENNGKVMKAKLSPSIWKYVDSKLNPDETDIEDGAEPVNVFDLWEGANLKIRAYNGKNDMRSYDKTVWMDRGPLFKDDEKLEEIYSQVKGLASEVDPANPAYKKSYAELDAKLELVLGRPLVKNQKEDVDHSSDLKSKLEEDLDDDEDTSPSQESSLEDDELNALLTED